MDRQEKFSLQAPLEVCLQLAVQVVHTVTVTRQSQAENLAAVGAGTAVEPRSSLNGRYRLFRRRLLMALCSCHHLTEVF